MASRLFRSTPSLLIKISDQQIRNGYILRGKHPLYAKTLKQRLEELNYKDPEIHYTVDIGFPINQKAQRQLTAQWIKEAQGNKRNRDLERKARYRELIIDLEEIKQNWLKTVGPKHIRTIANHYGIFKDLYGDAYFHPIVPLTIHYDYDDPQHLAKVYHGNLIKPDQARKAPNVTYESDKDSLWTLLLTTPDGNLTEVGSEFCHWFVGNIPGNSVEKGDQLIDYLRPIPCRGIGYCRYIFVLYKQNEKVDFSEYKKEQPCLQLKERNWNTYNFYRKYQDVLTPAGLAFFQSDWDQSLTDFYHHTLNMEEPIFEYDFPERYLAKQTWFPKKKPFDTYLDKYRDPKEINKEFLVKKLAKVHPFKEPEPPLKYPNAHPFRTTIIPSWLRTRLRLERLGRGRVNEIK